MILKSRECLKCGVPLSLKQLDALSKAEVLRANFPGIRDSTSPVSDHDYYCPECFDSIPPLAFAQEPKGAEP